MKFVTVLLLCLFSSMANAADEAALTKKFQLNDSQKAVAAFLKDAAVKRIVKEKEQKLLLQHMALGKAPLLAADRRDNCEDDSNEDRGEDRCWEACTKEGWSSSTCKDRCGTDTGSGEESCWDKCSAEGWSSSTCQDRCGTDSQDGVDSCWDQCSKEGWSSSTCEDRCGKSVDRCWDKCTAEGWSSSTCQDRCSK